MYRVICLFVCFLATGFANHEANTTRVVGGQTAAVGQFPHQVSLRMNNRHFCGGSIIGPQKILTAAHCIYGNNNIYSMTVVVGTNYLHSGGTAYKVSRTSYHSSYDPQSITNDVAVVKLQKPIEFNDHVRSIQLSNSNVAPGTPLTLSGWGLTTYPGNLPNSLQFIHLRSMSLQQCSQNLLGTNPINAGHICTGSQPGYGACQGDSGGPLISGHGVQVGVVSWGVPCARGRPDVFTSVASYLPWIQSQ